MSAAAGVPLTRELLEALRMTAADVALGHDGILSVHARRLADACAAALASDAGTPCPHCHQSPCTTESAHLGTPEGEPHALDCAISEVGARHGCTCGVEPLDESGAAPDAELDGLILAHASTVHQHPQDSFALGKTHQAIRAHVAQVKREAREEGRAEMGEVVPAPEYQCGHIDAVSGRMCYGLRGHHTPHSFAAPPERKNPCQAPKISREDRV